MKTTRQALIIVGIGVCICYAAYSYLENRYCWNCTSQDYFDKGTALIFKDDNKSKQRGLRFLESAAQKWHVDAQILLGELYLGSFPDGYYTQNDDKIAALRNNVPVDEKKGASYFDKLAVSLYSATGNYVEMLYNLGILLKMGVIGGPNNKEEARKWFSMSAERGNIHAMYELGMYYNSKGDYEKARQWFTNAFNGGEESRSAIMIGDYYFYGKGLVKDYHQSVQWYSKALNTVGRSDLIYSKKVREQVTQNARHRLKIAQTRRQGTPVTYSLAGGVRSYSIYTPDLTGKLIGAVHNENGNIQAHLEEGILPDLPDSGSTDKTVASMNEGLYWVLNAYATHTYGADKDFSFVLARKRDHLK
jgi:tetratricopeptide (TPR) repeat protein